MQPSEPSRRVLDVYKIGQTADSWQDIVQFVVDVEIQTDQGWWKAGQKSTDCRCFTAYGQVLDAGERTGDGTSTNKPLLRPGILYQLPGGRIVKFPAIDHVGVVLASFWL